MAHAIIGPSDDESICRDTLSWDASIRMILAQVYASIKWKPCFFTSFTMKMVKVYVVYLSTTGWPSPRNAASFFSSFPFCFCASQPSSPVKDRDSWKYSELSTPYPNALPL